MNGHTYKLCVGCSAIAGHQPRGAWWQLDQQRQEAARRQPQQRQARQAQQQSGLSPCRSSSWSIPWGPAQHPVSLAIGLKGKTKRSGT